MKKVILPEEVPSYIKRKGFSFFLFYGENEFYKDSIIEEIKNELIYKELRELNFRMFHGDEIANDVSPLIEFVRSFPFMSDRKLAVVKETEKISNSELNTLLDYLKNPVDFSRIIFTAQKPDFKISFFEYIKNSGKAIQFKQLNELETISWIKKTAGKMGIEMKQEACVYLYYIVGNNLYELYSELQKILFYYGKGSKIGLNEVKFMVSSLKNYTIFDLIDSICSKKLVDSLKMFNTYLEREGKEKVALILGMLTRQLTLIQKTKGILKTGGNIKKIQTEIQPYTFLAKRLIRQANYWTEEEIEKTLSRLSEIDAFIKTGLSAHLLMEYLIISICSPTEPSVEPPVDSPDVST